MNELEHERGDILQKGGGFFGCVMAFIIAQGELGAAAEAVQTDRPVRFIR